MSEETDPKKPEIPSPVASCHVCGQVICRKCRTPHHRECWRYNRGCAVYGCLSRIFETASPGQDLARERASSDTDGNEDRGP